MSCRDKERQTARDAGGTEDGEKELAKGSTAIDHTAHAGDQVATCIVRRDHPLRLIELIHPVNVDSINSDRSVLVLAYTASQRTGDSRGLHRCSARPTAARREICCRVPVVTEIADCEPSGVRHWDRIVCHRCDTSGMPEIDPRRVYDYAVGWVHELMKQVLPSQLDLATPCPEFTVRALMGHLIGTGERGLATAQGRPTGLIPHVINDVADDELSARYRALGELLQTAWLQLDPAQSVQAPWGATTADRAAWGFATETLVHGWDLAVATGQHSEADPEMVRPVLDGSRTTVPKHGRKSSYGEAVISRPGVGATEQLANWLGHQR